MAKAIAVNEGNAAEQAIQVVHDIRNATPIGLSGRHHPFAELPLADHPFITKEAKTNS